MRDTVRIFLHVNHDPYAAGCCGDCEATGKNLARLTSDIRSGAWKSAKGREE